MLDFETKLRRYLCMVPAVCVCILCGIAMAVFFDEEALHYHIANPLAVMIVPVLILVFCGGLTLLEWLYETAFRICEAIRAVFGGLTLGFLILVVGFNDPVALPEITVNIGLPVFVTMILPLLLYLILMKFDKKRTIQRIQNEQ